MLSSESLDIAALFRQTMPARYGETDLASRFRIVRHHLQRADQDRQDAVIQLLGEQRLDLMVVIGGYNSSKIPAIWPGSARQVPTFHIADPTAWRPPTWSATGT